MSLLVVGSVAYDSVQTAYGSRDDVLGGSATYFSLAASLFAQPMVVGVVGDDFRGADLETMSERGVDISGIEKVAGGKTFRWGGRYHEDMNSRDTLFTHLNVFENFQPKLGEVHRDASFVFLGNIQPSLQNDVLEQVGSPRFVAADTMNLWISSARSELLGVLERVDMLMLNDEEAFQLTDARTVRAAARRIQDFGPETVVIKRGEHGAIMFTSDDIFYCPAYPLEVVIDPTGAGDTFAGGFMGHLANTLDFSPLNMRRAMVVGSLMASYCVEGFSVDHLLGVSMDDVHRRYQAFKAMTHFDAFNLD